MLPVKIWIACSSPVFILVHFVKKASNLEKNTSILLYLVQCLEMKSNCHFLLMWSFSGIKKSAGLAQSTRPRTPCSKQSKHSEMQFSENLLKIVQKPMKIQSRKQWTYTQVLVEEKKQQTTFKWSIWRAGCWATGATLLGKKAPLLFKKQSQHHVQSRGKEEPCTCAPSLLQGGLCQQPSVGLLSYTRFHFK